MVAPTSPDPGSPGSTGSTGGAWNHLSALAAAKLAYLRARLELAGLEGQEAAIQLGVALAVALCAIVALIFAYFFLVTATVFVIALAFGGGNAWIWVLFGAAFVHLCGAAALGLFARFKLAGPFFPMTLEELKKDQEWLKSTARQP